MLKCLILKQIKNDDNKLHSSVQQEVIYAALANNINVLDVHVHRVRVLIWLVNDQWVFLTPKLYS